MINIQPHSTLGLEFLQTKPIGRLRSVGNYGADSGELC
jgi:hypothetical protein